MIDDPVASLPPLREVIANHSLSADKRFGQNFLFDLNLTGRIARTAGDLSQGTTIEIGPGPGGLTRALLLAGATRVVAIERDPRCLTALADLQIAAQGRLELISGDALEIDAASLGPAPRRIVANLPYNVATPLLIGWLKRMDDFVSLTLMFQKEVADRITAPVDSDAYGRLSVLSQYLADPRSAFDISPRAFTPPPKVTSTVVHLMPRPRPDPDCRVEDLESVTAAAFGQRRKMLRSSLKSLGVDTAALLEAAGLDPTARAETIGVADFVRLTRLYREFKDRS